MKRINQKDSQAYEDYLNYDASEESAEGNYSEEEQRVWDDKPQTSEESLYNELGEYRSRQEYLHQLEASLDEDDSFQEEPIPSNDSLVLEAETQEQPKQKRAKYSAKVDRFLTNGIIIVTVLLIAVLLIAFLV